MDELSSQVLVLNLPTNDDNVVAGWVRDADLHYL